MPADGHAFVFVLRGVLRHLHRVAHGQEHVRHIQGQYALRVRQVDATLKRAVGGYGDGVYQFFVHEQIIGSDGNDIPFVFRFVQDTSL